MTSFQPQIESLAKQLSQKFPDIIFFKEGPAEESIKTNLVGKNTHSYLKAFCGKGNELGRDELSFMRLFNSWSVQHQAFFSGPCIEEYQDSDNVYFLMKDITKSGKIMIDFSKLSQQDLVRIYEIYRLEFSHFEQFTQGKFSSQKEDKLQSAIQFLRFSATSLSPSEKIDIQKIVTTTISTKKTEQLRHWINQGKNIVQETISCDPEKYLSFFQQLQEEIVQYDFEYSFCRFWTGHVFGDGISYQLEDFDSIGYQIQGNEILGMIRSTLFLSIEKYVSYDERRSDFSFRHKYLQEKIPNQTQRDLLLFQKLIGTIFMDFGHLMLTIDLNRNKISSLGIAPEDHTKRGILWNTRLLHELFAL